MRTKCFSSAALLFITIFSTAIDAIAATKNQEMKAFFEAESWHRKYPECCIENYGSWLPTRKKLPKESQRITSEMIFTKVIPVTCSPEGCGNPGFRVVPFQGDFTKELAAMVSDWRQQTPEKKSLLLFLDKSAKRARVEMILKAVGNSLPIQIAFIREHPQKTAWKNVPPELWTRLNALKKSLGKTDPKSISYRDQLRSFVEAETKSWTKPCTGIKNALLAALKFQGRMMQLTILQPLENVGDKCPLTTAELKSFFKLVTQGIEPERHFYAVPFQSIPEGSDWQKIIDR